MQLEKQFIIEIIIIVVSAVNCYYYQAVQKRWWAMKTNDEKVIKILIRNHSLWMVFWELKRMIQYIPISAVI